MTASSTSDAFSAARVRAALAPFGFEASPEICEQTRVYAELLLKWNKKLNLTAIVEPREILERHFGESLFALSHLPSGPQTGLQTLIDIGSGAGFPGLVLKMARPEMEVTLLEPVLKKAAFLKEAARALGLDVRVRSQRTEDCFVEGIRSGCFTSRAIRLSMPLVQEIHDALVVHGKLIAWLGSSDAQGVKGFRTMQWQEIAIPGSEHRVLLVGEKTS